MQEKKNYINEEEDYFEEFSENDWNVNMMQDSDVDQWNNEWEDKPDEEFSKKIRNEIEKYKNKVSASMNK